MSVIILTATGCERVAVLPSEKESRASENAHVERYSGTMTWQLVDHATDSLCNATITTTMQLTLYVALNGTVRGEGRIIYDDVQFDPSFVAPRCPSCALVGTMGALRLKGQRLTDNPAVLAVRPTLWSGLTEEQTSAQCSIDAENGTQTTHHIAFSLQQAGFFDRWRVDTTGIPTSFNFDVAGRRASGVLTLTRVP